MARGTLRCSLLRHKVIRLLARGTLRCSLLRCESFVLSELVVELVCYDFGVGLINHGRSYPVLVTNKKPVARGTLRCSLLHHRVRCWFVCLSSCVRRDGERAGSPLAVGVK